MKSEVIDTKIVCSGNNRVYHIYRTRCGMLDTLTLRYQIKSGTRTITRKVPFFMGFPLQKVVELAADRI
ncbi:hypothetical protein [Acetivibrio mesophilus]|uniref:Uncharacterized protein n=1 Tax=Acetivibrio mesophilus TaxID=2487273 RepID=A0A4Q0I225_9FIRM|nr:hypothetical protein [Acetivibrio mesophilus]RXE57737.1 hypothetical protein EFD62_16110 [Acetivibrio mesophilus]